MTPLTIAKLALALTAAILFGLGVRTDLPALRWAAIGFLTFAVLLRFFDKKRKDP
ncbi:MAG TPA: hypothetical protein VM939_05500 [Gemmatimonadaceae bacterium]|nr:hypothetical protein [Gemmatimonadaceae bacterium]